MVLEEIPLMPITTKKGRHQRNRYINIINTRFICIIQSCTKEVYVIAFYTKSVLVTIEHENRSFQTRINKYSRQQINLFIFKMK